MPEPAEPSKTDAPGPAESSKPPVTDEKHFEEFKAQIKSLKICLERKEVTINELKNELTFLKQTERHRNATIDGYKKKTLIEFYRETDGNNWNDT
eukprot:UN09509